MTEDGTQNPLPRPLKWLVTSWKTVVTVAAGMTTIVVLVFLIFPGWKPREACRGKLGGTLSEVTVDERVRYGKYLELEQADKGTASREELNTAGRVVHFSIETHGFMGKKLGVEWSILTRGGEPVEPELTHQLARNLSPDECNDGGRRNIWVKLPKRQGAYKAEVRLLDPQGGELDDKRTNVFTVRQ